MAHDCLDYWHQEADELFGRLAMHVKGAGLVMDSLTYTELAGAQKDLEDAVGDPNMPPKPWVRLIQDDPALRNDTIAFRNWLRQDRNAPGAHNPMAPGWISTGLGADDGAIKELRDVLCRVKNALGS